MKFRFLYSAVLIILRANAVIFYKLIYIQVTQTGFYVHFLKTQKQTFIKIREMYLLTNCRVAQLGNESAFYRQQFKLLKLSQPVFLKSIFHSSPPCYYIYSLLFPTLLLYLFSILPYSAPSLLYLFSILSYPAPVSILHSSLSCSDI